MNKESNFCYFHPEKSVIGVCAPCLNQRLLLLSAANPKFKQKRNIFAQSSIFFNKNRKPRDNNRCGLTSSSSPEDTFISIKFEENGIPSWEKGEVSKMAIDPQCNKMTETHEDKGVVELHAKPRAMLRWRRRIGHLFQLVRLKKSTKGNTCHVGVTKPRRSRG